MTNTSPMMPSSMSPAMDPLAQLNDIHLPPAINQLPVAPGWWFLVLSAIALALYIVIKIYRYKKRCQVKKQAIATIKNNHLADADIVATLKWASLHYFPRADVAALYGEKFQQFLTAQLSNTHQEAFNQLSIKSMNNLYQANTKHSANLEQAALMWLNEVLPTTEKAGAKS